MCIVRAPNRRVYHGVEQWPLQTPNPLHKKERSGATFVNARKQRTDCGVVCAAAAAVAECQPLSVVSVQIRILNKLTNSAECEFEPRQYFRPILSVPFDGWPSLCRCYKHTFCGNAPRARGVSLTTTTTKIPPIGVLDVRLLVSSSSALICARTFSSLVLRLRRICCTIFHFFSVLLPAFVVHFFFLPFSGSAWFFIRAQITIGRIDVCSFVR